MKDKEGIKSNIKQLDVFIFPCFLLNVVIKIPNFYHRELIAGMLVFFEENMLVVICYKLVPYDFKFSWAITSTTKPSTMPFIFIILFHYSKWYKSISLV